MTLKGLLNVLGCCVVLAPVLTGCGGRSAEDDNVPATQSARTELNLEEWAEVISKTPVPNTGCFRASHPSTAWNEVPCTVAPNRPHRSKRFASDPPAEIAPVPATDTNPPALGNGLRVQSLRPRPAVNGGGYRDFTAAVPYFAMISRAEGSFPSVTGLTSVTDDQLGQGSYSLQVNSDEFPTNARGACSGHAATCQNYSVDCRCWQQFILDNRPDSPIEPEGDGYGYYPESAIFMQYWLVNVGGVCPASGGWEHSGQDCYRNSRATNLFWVDPVNLQHVRFIAAANAGGNDTVTLVYGSSAFAQSETDNEFALAKGWTQAGFNIFGDGAGASANFNSGTKVVVKENVTSHTSTGVNNIARPSCLEQSTTGERNNLGYGSCCVTGGRPAILAGQAPGIQFEESNPANSGGSYCLSTSLAAGVSWQIQPGAALDIGVADDTVWIIGTNNTVFKWDATVNNWSQSNGWAARIAVQADGVPWVIDPYGAIFQKQANTVASAWTQRPGCAKDIGIGTDGSVWIVGCSAVNGGYGMFKWNGTNWVMDATGGGATRIAVDSTGKPWIVNSYSEIFQRSSADPSNGYWQIVPGGARDIGIGPEGYPWIIGTSSTWGGYNIFAWDDRPGNWTSVPGGGSQISVGRNGRPWITNANGEIFQALN